MPHLTLTRGIPASGKSTWARAWVAESPETRVRVNRDDLRRMFHGQIGGLPYAIEQAVTTATRRLVRDALDSGRDVVLDETNLRSRFLREWLALYPDLTVRDFPVDLDTAIGRDLARENSVGADVVRRFYDRFTNKGALPALPDPSSRTRPTGEPYEPDVTLPPAFIVDVDGTLAHINAVTPRDPYDGSRVHEDILDPHVDELVSLLRNSDMTIIVVTGRDARYRDTTEQWLRDNDVEFDELYTRPADDVRKDDVVKLELFDAHIRHRFNVRGVLDDRDRVVRMWRDIGLKTYQVQEGAF